MSWKYTLDLLESYTFECIHVHQNHNHKGIPQDQCDNLIECEYCQIASKNKWSNIILKDLQLGRYSLC
ncbi:unnamed protein product [Blepharisma stoltei]|uniref:Uncharacterized protein n=1 Tax=Blepharisma stoltei TaxID=1481888 RepID=A0AAU9ICC4_9CILI|nr:unnamed protein product [Blepharisma stoltei]